MQYTLMILVLLSANRVWAQEQGHAVKCDYTYMSVPFTTLRFTIYSGGQLSPTVVVGLSEQGSHEESLVAELPSAGEIAHGWISKETPENTVELIVYKQNQAQGRTKVVNHNVPFAKEVWGKCEGLP